MGSSASVSTPDSTPEKHKSKANRHPQNGETPTAGNDVDLHMKDTLVRTNKVAPVVIKSCKEEFQHHTDFKEPIVYGKIADDMPEHALIMNQYFMVKDISPTIDKLGTLKTYNAPNVRQAKGGYPVWGMGQPTREGIINFITKLTNEGHENVLLLNLREEPVVFLKQEFDYVPYSPRHYVKLDTCPLNQNTTNEHVTEIEVKIRKELLELAAFRDDQSFYFYDDVHTCPTPEPQLYRSAYEDDMCVTDEVYWRLEFNNPQIKYHRLTMPQDGAPDEADIDAFIQLFKHIPSSFNHSITNFPAVVFTSHTGGKRATFGMALGCLMIAQKKGFPPDSKKSPLPINEKSPNYERGEFNAIQRLVKYLPKGSQRKHEVDAILDFCSEHTNLRSIPADLKHKLEDLSGDIIVEGTSAKEYLYNDCMSMLERYFYLICINAYLHDQYKSLFGESFKQWMAKQPELYHILTNMDVSERTTTPALLTQSVRCLVADDYIGLDVMSSQREVKVSNFRRVPGTCVYGMAMPARDGLSCVVNHLLSKKQGHPLVVWFNLREDIVLECNGATYSWREQQNLEAPIIMPGISETNIANKEELFKNEVKNTKTFQIYEETTDAAVTKEFTSVLTCQDLYQQQKLQTKGLHYHRIPMSDDKAPHTKIFDRIMSVILSFGEVYTDEDGPALVFQCRTGKGRTTTAMAIAGLVLFHKKGFPYGTKPGEEERVSLQNAIYTQGYFKIVQELVRKIPNGQQVKREVDFVLNQCSETMTPMHYHMREMIFVTYNKMKKVSDPTEKELLKKQSLDYLERYMYLILFNTYLHCQRRNQWKTSFTDWMQKVAYQVGIYDILDNISFTDFESQPEKMRTRRKRWNFKTSKLPLRGELV